MSFCHHNSDGLGSYTPSPERSSRPSRDVTPSGTHYSHVKLQALDGTLTNSGESPTFPSYLSNHHDPQVVYPTLPTHEKWLSTNQIAFPNAGCYVSSQYDSINNKRKRGSVDGIEPLTTKIDLTTSDLKENSLLEPTDLSQKKSRRGSVEAGTVELLQFETANATTAPFVPSRLGRLEYNRLNPPCSCGQRHIAPGYSRDFQATDCSEHRRCSPVTSPDPRTEAQHVVGCSVHQIEADTIQQVTFTGSRPAQRSSPISIPGAYPVSSQEILSRFPNRDLAEPKQPLYLESISTPSSPSPGHHPGISVAADPEEPPLCPEQADLVDLICSGRNVFYTGSAGCGKSTVLKAFTKRLRNMGKNVHVVAPTGRSALQVGGKTFWTYAGWTPQHMKRPLETLKEAAHGKYTWKRLKTETDVIVFDEVSMIENHIFERLNELLKEAWYRPHKEEQPAFGGVQVIITGDFCQLPPVKPFQYCMHCGTEMTGKARFGSKTYTCPQHGEFRDEDKWAFSSKAWQECNFVHVHLKQIHRQSDREFIRMLQKCRVGDPLSSQEVDTLMDHECQVNNATKLFATREQVREVNQTMFKKLTGVNNWYWSRDVFIWKREEHPHLRWKGGRKAKGPPGAENLEELRPLIALDEHRYEEFIELKQGMLVVLLVNLNLDLGLCNGSQGLICGFEQYDPAKLPRAKTSNKDEPLNRITGERALLKEQEIKAFIKGKGARYRRWPVVRFHNGQTRVIYADCSISELGDKQPYSLLARTQIPLAPAWAMTIHKSQGLTLDRVIVNLSKAFEEGQIYVALSRATSLRGLKIEGSAEAFTSGLGGNREVQRFLREKFGALNALCSK